MCRKSLGCLWWLGLGLMLRRMISISSPYADPRPRPPPGSRVNHPLSIQSRAAPAHFPPLKAFFSSLISRVFVEITNIGRGGPGLAPEDHHGIIICKRREERRGEVCCGDGGGELLPASHNN